ncbi:MAG: tetratricopeptide repeat protein [Bradymonadales bacterium]|nr:tetratricopeptide repeat protein [Bradymonadales bacterium]
MGDRALWDTLLREAENLDAAGERVRAIEVAREAIAAAKDELPPTDLRLAEAYHTLSSLLVDPSEVADALQQEIEILAAQRPASDPAIGRILSALSRALLAAKRFDEAGPVMERAIGRIKATEGPNSESLGLELLVMGDFLRYGGRLEDAELRYRQALSVTEQLRGADHPDVADILDRLVDILAERGQSDEAQLLLDRIHQIRG